MSFDVYKLMYKLWGQGDQNWGFWGDNWRVPEREQPKQADLFWCSSLELAAVSCTG